MLGIEEVDNGNAAGIQTVYTTGPAAGSQFSYLYGTDADYSVDAYIAGEGQALFYSDDQRARAVAYNSGTWRVVTSAVILGAMADDQENGNTKATVMGQILQFLSPAFTGTDDDVVSITPVLLKAWPNPFNPTISFELSGMATNQAQLKIYNLKGQHQLSTSLKSGTYTWEANNMPSGIYLARVVQAGKTLTVKKITLLK